MAYLPRDSYPGQGQQYPLYHDRMSQGQAEAVTSIPTSQYNGYNQSQNVTAYPASTRPQQSTPQIVSDDGHKMSLPSISNLLGIADGDRTSQDGRAHEQQAAHTSQGEHSYAATQATPSQLPQQQASSHPQPSQYATNGAESDSRNRASHPPQDQRNTYRPMNPPPLIRSDSIADTTDSPSTISTASSSIPAQSYYLGSALNNVEADHQQRTVVAQMVKRASVHSQPNTSPYDTSPFGHPSSSYSASPGTLHSNGPPNYYSPQVIPVPNAANYPLSGLYTQRPLPQQFPPTYPQQPPPPHLASSEQAYYTQHHHYISQSSAATYPQSQDRYICPTCSKAFSRPSSLKIHSHSHTGEKPFKCPHGGCGKAFSVRSNMKRHERGCHTGLGGGGGAGSE
ncbi:hypothetical protein B0A48_11800 [Cryoendolithus antarcticus]|uniref:C2H2-type domain-containing protein n=1 Tax=Cryoendolithus antarcticus TaxID=1507870 RepID=A0A1V8SSX2_9PEZI|nr:hypothetical protein B0A48_11800 [Cryoendolithus antarcticus]